MIIYSTLLDNTISEISIKDFKSNFSAFLTMEYQQGITLELHLEILQDTDIYRLPESYTKCKIFYLYYTCRSKYGCIHFKLCCQVNLSILMNVIRWPYTYSMLQAVAPSLFKYFSTYL